MTAEERATLADELSQLAAILLELAQEIDPLDLPGPSRAARARHLALLAKAPPPWVLTMDPLDLRYIVWSDINV